METSSRGTLVQKGWEPLAHAAELDSSFFFFLPPWAPAGVRAVDIYATGSMTLKHINYTL